MINFTAIDGKGEPDEAFSIISPKKRP